MKYLAIIGFNSFNSKGIFIYSVIEKFNRHSMNMNNRLTIELCQTAICYNTIFA